MKWIKFSEREPQQTGEYNVKTNHGNSIAFWVGTLKGKKDWLCINEDCEVIEWLER